MQKVLPTITMEAWGFKFVESEQVILVPFNPEKTVTDNELILGLPVVTNVNGSLGILLDVVVITAPLLPLKYPLTAHKWVVVSGTVHVYLTSCPTQSTVSEEDKPFISNFREEVQPID